MLLARLALRGCRGLLVPLGLQVQLELERQDRLALRDLLVGAVILLPEAHLRRRIDRPLLH